MQPATAAVAALIAGITPYDELEQRHAAAVSAWLDSTDDIFRRTKPATPSPHLVSYVVLTDPDARAIYLGRHRKAGLHLPMGGHVDPGEHPSTTAHREAVEELALTPTFDVIGPHPVFLTWTTTVGLTAGHIDVSLWYVIRGDHTRTYPLDPTEFDGGQWWPLTPSDLPPTDPHLPRFIGKLNTLLAQTREPK